MAYGFDEGVVVDVEGGGNDDVVVAVVVVVPTTASGEAKLRRPRTFIDDETETGGGIRNLDDIPLPLPLDEALLLVDGIEPPPG